MLEDITGKLKTNIPLHSIDLHAHISHFEEATPVLKLDIFGKASATREWKSRRTHRHDFLQASSWCHTDAPCETSVCARLRRTMKVSNKTSLFCIGRRCRRRRFRWDLPPVTNGQENVACSLRISVIRNSSTIQSVNSPSCGWCLKKKV